MDYGLSIAQAIAELGVLVVIAGIFLYIVLKNNKKQDEVNTQLFKAIMDQLQAGNTHVLTEEEDRVAMKIDKTINLLLQSAVADLGASRAVVSRYHNGGKDMNSISFLKFSVTNESVGLGYKPVITDFQNQFRAMLAYPIGEIDKTGNSFITNIEDIRTKDPGTYEVLKGKGLRSFYAHKITNASGYVIGAIVITYSTDNATQENPEYVRQYVDHLGSQISGLMNAKDM